MERTRGITVYGVTLIIFGIYNLIGIGNYKQFSAMFDPLPSFVVAAVYIFTILYGICGVYCGSRLLRLEEWARKVIVVMASVSVISGFLLNRVVMANFKEYIASGRADVPPELTGSVYMYAVVIAALITLFELSVIFYFTRPKVAAMFKQDL